MAGVFGPGIAKGKRSKRRRSSAAVAVESTSTEETASGCVTEEEEETAQSLILLAQGAGRPGRSEKFRSRRPAPADGEVAGDGGRPGMFVYECQTCSKCFPSFQALGGHRASHKKPRLAPPSPDAVADDKKDTASGAGAVDEDEKAFLSLLSSPRPASLPRVHECTICGAQFTSGQALGGHMRRHRPLAAAAGSDSSPPPPPPTTATTTEVEISLFHLDLNIPVRALSPSPVALTLAPPAADADPRPFIFSPLVGCHY